jgi:hypothetical protein
LFEQDVSGTSEFYLDVVSDEQDEGEVPEVAGFFGLRPRFALEEAAPVRASEETRECVSGKSGEGEVWDTVTLMKRWDNPAAGADLVEPQEDDDQLLCEESAAEQPEEGDSEQQPYDDQEGDGADACNDDQRPYDVAGFPPWADGSEKRFDA